MSKILDLTRRVDKFEFTFDGYTLAGTFYKWRTTSPGYQRKKAARIAALPKVPDNATDADAEKILNEIEKTIREINAQIMADTIASWDAVEEFALKLDAEGYADCSPRIQKHYKRVSDDDESLGYELVDPKLADQPQPIPVCVEVFEELPTMFNRALGEYFQKLRDETLNPTKPDSSQSG